jgi:threonylcarbamoyladenosine tRNA methylthiotransferase MtaB
LPLQSGSDLILRLMNRNYTARTYQKKLLRLAAISSDIALGTDVIAGFPAEGDKEFMSTYTMIKELPFSYVHTFPYSARIGTVAADLKPQIPGNITSDRVEMLKELNRAKQEAFISAQTDKTLDAIAEGEDASGYTTGTTSNYLKVDVQGSSIKRGSVVFVRTTAVQGDRLRGVMIS